MFSKSSSSSSSSSSSLVIRRLVMVGPAGAAVQQSSSSQVLLLSLPISYSSKLFAYSTTKRKRRLNMKFASQHQQNDIDDNNNNLLSRSSSASKIMGRKVHTHALPSSSSIDTLLPMMNNDFVVHDSENIIDSGDKDEVSDDQNTTRKTMKPSSSISTTTTTTTTAAPKKTLKQLLAARKASSVDLTSLIEKNSSISKNEQQLDSREAAFFQRLMNVNIGSSSDGSSADLSSSSSKTQQDDDDASSSATTTFNKIMTIEDAHKLKTYRADYSGGYETDLPSIYTSLMHSRSGIIITTGKKQKQQQHQQRRSYSSYHHFCHKNLIHSHRIGREDIPSSSSSLSPYQFQRQLSLLQKQNAQQIRSYHSMTSSRSSRSSPSGHHHHLLFHSTKLSQRSYLNSFSTAPSWPSRANGWLNRLSDIGTPNQPFAAKLHPNFVSKTGGFCYLCGSSVLGGRDHHISFDRDHIALSYFYFLVCTMKREWDPQGVLRESATFFPTVWEKMVAPPLKFHRYFSTAATTNKLMNNNNNNQKKKGLFVTREDDENDNTNTESSLLDDELSRRKLAMEKFEFKKQKLSPYLNLESLSHKHYNFATGEEHPEVEVQMKKKLQQQQQSSSSSSSSSKQQQQPLSSLSSLQLSSNSGNNKLQQEFLRNQQILKSHHEQSATAFSSPESVRRHILATTDRASISNAEIEKELQKLQGNLAMSFAPTWWALQQLQDQRIELQALLTVAMDEDAEFFKNLNDGGTLANRSVCAQLPPGLIGQGEKTFRADVTRVVAAVLPVSAPMVTAAFAQKSWGRTNLSRLYDSLHIERIHEKVLGRPVVPRQGRSEKSGAMRQLLTELHYYAAKERGCEEDDEEDENENEDQEERNHHDHHQSKQERTTDDVLIVISRTEKMQRRMLSAQLAEMILARLSTEAVLTMSHIYMDRAWRVAALTGYPSPEELDRIDYS